jgi:hypothetical protein
MSTPAPFPYRTCPCCGASASGYTALEDGTKPAESDLNICAHCAGISVHEANGLLRRASLEERTEALADERVRQTVDSILERRVRS